jgi:hypothetical protein
VEVFGVVVWLDLMRWSGAGENMIHFIFQIIQAAPPSPYEWMLHNLPLVGWPTLCFCAWKVSGYFQKLVTQVKTTVNQIDVMSTNHFPHMQESLSTQDTIMKSMDSSLLDMRVSLKTLVTLAEK